MIGGHLLHGGDYNPEQWIEYPEILEEDLKLMNKANVNCVTLGVFSWAELEPKEDVYTFEWLEEIIDKLRERKIQEFWRLRREECRTGLHKSIPRRFRCRRTVR